MTHFPDVPATTTTTIPETSTNARFWVLTALHHLPTPPSACRCHHYFQNEHECSFWGSPPATTSQPWTRLILEHEKCVPMGAFFVSGTLPPLPIPSNTKYGYNDWVLASWHSPYCLTSIRHYLIMDLDTNICWLWLFLCLRKCLVCLSELEFPFLDGNLNPSLCLASSLSPEVKNKLAISLVSQIHRET